MHENGAADQAADGLPAITVVWDAANQAVGLKFRPEDFRTWEFIKAVLGMALAKADDTQRVIAAGMMRQAQMEQQQAQALHNRILRGR